MRQERTLGWRWRCNRLPPDSDIDAVGFAPGDVAERLSQHSARR
jgi:hypothetical protein